MKYTTLIKYKKKSIDLPFGIDFGIVNNNIIVYNDSNGLTFSHHISPCLTVYYENSKIILDILKPFRYYKASKMLLNNLYGLISTDLKGITEYFQAKISVLGFSYFVSILNKFKEYDYYMIFNFGLHRKAEFKIPRYIFFETTCKYSTEIYIYSSDIHLFKKMIQYILSLHRTTVYKLKGIYYNDKYPVIKKSKKKQ